ncbi:MAG: endo-1,4-beta-xylanase, partial [Lewinella sp.]
MSRFIPLCFSLFFTSTLLAQPDAYHENLIEWLSTQYTLTGETFPFADTEDEHIAMFNSYNAASEEVLDDMNEQDFAKVESIRISAPTTNRWDVGWNGTNTQAIALGDKVLWVIYLRATGPEENGRVTLFAERNDNFAKETEATVELSTEWKRYFIPFEIITRNQPVGGMTMGMHLGHQAQTIEIGGMAILNYGPSVSLDQLPNDLSSDEYGGFEPDAAWRTPAADRIDQLRKADMQLTVLDNSGNPLPDAQVEVRMQRHDFDFGTAVKASRFPGGREYNETFVNRINDLDGRGHGFSAVVFENDFKWPAWEDEWISTNAQTRRTLRYLNEQNIDIRGHVLLWPGWDNLPNRMEDNRTNPDYLKQQLEDHLVDFLQTENFDEFVKDWDVLNEINTNTDLAAALRGTTGYTTGREIYAETFARARELAPDAKLYINDYITLSLKNTEGAIIYDQYKDFIQELVDQNAPIDGIGFQAHLGASPNSIYEVLGTLDDFHDEFGLEAKITELDMPGNVSEELGAKYLKDFLTATFSHESMTGIMFWNFWDVDTWANPGINMYNENWTRTMPGDAYVDLVFNDWWTDEDVTTNAQGNATVRGFKGTYEVSVACPGGTGTIDVNLTEDEAITIDCATLVSTTLPELPAGS